MRMLMEFVNEDTENQVAGPATGETSKLIEKRRPIEGDCPIWYV
jgi:hypothetical protein